MFSYMQLLSITYFRHLEAFRSRNRFSGQSSPLQGEGKFMNRRVAVGTRNNTNEVGGSMGEYDPSNRAIILLKEELSGVGLPANSTCQVSP